MTLWGTGPALWTHHGARWTVSSPPAARRRVGGQPLEAVDDAAAPHLGGRYVIHNPQALLPSLSEFNSL